MEYVKLREIFAEALKDKQIVGTMFGGKIYRARKATGSEDYFILAPKKRNRGWYLSGIEGRIGKFEGIIEPKESRKSEADKWADSWKKAGKNKGAERIACRKKLQQDDRGAGSHRKDDPIL